VVKELRVRKSNKLTEARFKLTMNEYRILLLCVTKIKPKTQDVTNKYRIEVTEYAEVFGISLKNAYKQIETGLNASWEREFHERIPATENKAAAWRRRRFIITQEYHPGEGYGEVEFHPDFMQHLINLREQYTDYGVRNVAHLPSFNVIRMYELLTQFRTVGRRSFDVAWFRELMSLEDSYPRFQDLKTHVLVPALRAIDQDTDLNVLKQGKAWFSVTKRVKKVVAFEVCFRTKAQQVLELDEPEGLIDEPDWQVQGYASQGEFRESQGLQQTYGVAFASAKDFLSYRGKLRSSSSS
jgi:plasmid replication initiation protein